MVTDFEEVDPCAVIQDGDYVEVNGDDGTVTITREDQ